VERVAIIGAGIGGLYLVAELGIAGFKLRWTPFVRQPEPLLKV
jgi:cation diffusion facilitator CzcD-associated flavoprotein CzcO